MRTTTQSHATFKGLDISATVHVGLEGTLDVGTRQIFSVEDLEVCTSDGTDITEHLKTSFIVQCEQRLVDEARGL